MKVHLMHRDADFDPGAELPGHAETLAQDLGLRTLFDAMAARTDERDDYLYKIAVGAVMHPLTDADAIVYRQRILADCLDHPDLVRGLYDLAVEAVTGERGFYFGLFRDSPDAVMNRSVRLLDFLAVRLRKLRATADEHAAGFASGGFTRFFAMIAEELDDAYLAEVDAHLEELKFRRGSLISARLGPGNRGRDHVLRRQRRPRGLRDRLTLGERGTYGFTIADRDEAGIHALSDLRARGINDAANAVGQATDHIVAFFAALRAELAFYVGCLNLHDRLAAIGAPACLPEPVPSRRPVLTARGLYDMCLALHTGTPPVGNDLRADGRVLVMITGANSGGKSTLLRAIGLAQILTQAGMFAPAAELRTDLRDGVYTHFKREEDATMRSGKLDEELARMSAIADDIPPAGLLLCNESFASTNEREGSELARQIVHAMTDAGVKTVYVTHLYDLAHGLHTEDRADLLFLRAHRDPDGTRTYTLPEAEPLPTSHGADAFRRLFT
ncbi:MAG TPA: hypothetical protein VGL93_13655 [Streptosporangiaceae bacterium]|jgi:hypothetical protein